MSLHRVLPHVQFLIPGRATGPPESPRNVKRRRRRSAALSTPSTARSASFSDSATPPGPRPRAQRRAHKMPARAAAVSGELV